VRGLLVYNPNATTTTQAVTDVIAHALADALKLEVEATKRRDHASFLAAGAVHEGFDVVVALGGDGTINEVMQGVANTPARFAMIPGGSTNVWARTLGLPNDPIEATSVVLQKLRDGEQRVVNLGTANGRYFGFNAGYGFDAEAVRYVEERYLLKRTVRQASFVYCGVLAYFGAYRRRKARITLRLPGEDAVEGLRTVVCCNSNPFTFLGPLRAQLCPAADLDGGLDIAALTRWGMLRLLRVVTSALRGPNVSNLRSIRAWHDLDEFELSANGPVPLQVDGDYTGETDRVTFRLVPRALTVIA
jgi:diacylglycerol kinase family enzyme